MNKKDIEAAFPNLRHSKYQITSPETVEYNCVAWAVGDMETWWWPDPLETAFWPADVQRVETLEAFIEAFKTLSFTICDSPEYEEGYEKIAIYASANGKPTHAARQLSNGCWSSKLGRSYDIDHEINSVSGSNYGAVSVIMKRPV